MSKITVKDGTEIYYKDWGTGQPLFFHHGWPLSGDDWDGQMMFFLEQGFRVIAHDRRGHGRSSQTDTGNEMETYAADVAELVEALDLKDAVHIGHSTGGGEVIRYVAKYGKGRVAKAVLISAVTPIMVKTENNPDGIPWRYSTGSVKVRQQTGPNISRILPCLFTGITAKELKYHRELETIGGARA
jgi:non-heme chloroperoxidase